MTKSYNISNPESHKQDSHQSSDQTLRGSLKEAFYTAIWFWFELNLTSPIGLIYCHPNQYQIRGYSAQLQNETITIIEDRNYANDIALGHYHLSDPHCLDDITERIIQRIHEQRLTTSDRPTPTK